MSSSLFALGKFFLLEYIYSDNNFPTQFNTAQVGFKKIVNNHQGTNTLVNIDSAISKTYNVSDMTVVELSDSKYALLDSDAAFYYPAVDPEITINLKTFQPNVNVIYDTVRLHIISGYNFPDNDGVILRFDFRQNNNIPLLFANLALLKTEKRNLFYNPRPIRISQFIYDRYWEVKIPSQASMLDSQLSNPGINNTLAGQMTDGNGLANQNTLYVDFKTIRSSDSSQGVTYFIADSQERFALASRDSFSLLLPAIKLADDGDYFIYNASYDGMSLEDFIFSLNSMAGNDYIIYHELRVSEQISASYLETDNITSIQTDNYNIPKVFVPLIRNSGAVSFAIDYTMRLYNRADGHSIFKTASISSMDVNKFGKNKLQINVGNTLPIKVYNKIVSSEVVQVKDLGSTVVQTKYVPTYIDTSNIVVQVDDNTTITNAYAKDNVIMNLYPFDNHIRFNILKLIGGQISAIDLTSNIYYLAFQKDDDKILRIEELLTNTNKGNGELIFKIPQTTAQELLKQITHRFFITSINSDNEETTVAFGDFVDATNKPVDTTKTVDLTAISDGSTTPNVDNSGTITDTAANLNSSENLAKQKANVAKKVQSDQNAIQRNNVITTTTGN